jgi:hypothetical protein
LVEHAEIHRPPSARRKTLQQALTSLPIMGKKLGMRVRTQEPRRAGVIERGFSLDLPAAQKPSAAWSKLELKAKGK